MSIESIIKTCPECGKQKTKTTDGDWDVYKCIDCNKKKRAKALSELAMNDADLIGEHK